MDDATTTSRPRRLSAWRTRLLMVGAGALLAAVGVQLGAAQAANESAAPSAVVPVAPFRILDTRVGVGVAGAAPVGPDSVITLQIAGVGGIPADATGVVLNLTANQGTDAGYVTVYPTGSARPTASVLNITPGQDLPNMITTTLGDGGRIDLYNFTGAVHLIADVAGYLVATAGGAPGPQGPGGVTKIVTGERSSLPGGQPLSSSEPGDLIATLPMGAGSYGITAIVELRGELNSMTWQATCQLVAGAQTVTRRAGGATQNFDFPIITLQVAHTFLTDGQATVRCHDINGQGALWHSVTMTAIEAQSIQQVPLA